MTYIVFLEEVSLDDARQTGGKGANLGHLMQAGQLVPRAFSIKADAFNHFISENGLAERVTATLDSLDYADLEAVDDACASLRAAMEASPVPAEIEEEIRAAYRSLVAAEPGRLVAVRSSVGTRDLSRSSFPGQMDTYHNVASEDDVVALVTRCWASAFSYRAVVSRRSAEIGHTDVFVAPLVQLMVPSEIAGVVFTANPLNNRLDQMVVNACFGLGEGVVSGEVNADHYVLVRDSLEVLERAVGDKRVKFELDSEAGHGNRITALDQEECSRECLDRAQLDRLARVALEIESYYGCPQDIEWAFSGGQLYILQSRRITTLDRAAVTQEDEWVSEFDTKVDPRYPYYTLSNISEVLCGTLTPLTISGLDTLDYGFVKTNTDFGLMKHVKPASEHTFLGIFYGRAHLNLSVVKSITAQLPGASAQEFERMLPSEDDEGWQDEGFKPSARSLAVAAGSMARVLYRMLVIPREVVRMRRVLEQRIERAKSLDVGTMPYPRYLEWMEESRANRMEVVAHHIAVSQFAVVSYDFLRKLTERWLGDEQGTVAARLVTGLQNIESAQPSMEIWDLSRRVTRSDELMELFERHTPEEIRDALDQARRSRAATSEERALLAGLDTFLSRFGYRGVFEAELMLPNWGEDPSYVFAMIKNYLDSDPGLDPRALARKQQLEREKTSRDVLGRLGGPRRVVFRVLLARAQKFIAMREYTKASLIMGIAQIKREYQELAKRFVAEGALSDPGDIFFLTGDEVKEIAGGDRGGASVDARVARRRREYERNKTVVLPEYSRGRPRPLTGDLLEASDDVEVLSGIAVSPGRVTGPARVITDPRSNSEIRPGEILVAPVTDAAWTPLFVTAGAIVVDVGGPLSHGSIVAREYGIPGVLNVGVATRLIRTGQVVTVDGDQGKVFLHPGND